MVNTQARKAKKQAKQRKILRAVKLATSCQLHGGPLTIKSLHLLDKLDEKQLINEVLYLKATIAGEIKVRKRVKDKVTAKFMMMVLPIDILKCSIKSVVNPTLEEHNVEELLSTILN